MCIRDRFTRLGKKAYPVLCSSPEKAIATADEHIAAGHVPDIVFFDLPGTVNSEGVINSLAGMDYIFTPISADKVVLESSLSFAMAIQKLLVRNEACRCLLYTSGCGHSWLVSPPASGRCRPCR